ncbi:hypothetical protein ACP275_06G163900 [Erythranthe tilingii]
MEEPKNNPVHEEEEEREKNPIILFFTSVLSSIKLPFPPPKMNAVKVEPAAPQAAEPIAIKPAAVEIEAEKPVAVTFPKQSFAPLKLEAESEEAERSTNPVFLWQVYAVGGFVVLRWAWKRWNERKGQKKPDDDEPPPAHD